MKIVYEIERDYQYGYLLPVKVEERSLLEMNCVPKANNWQSIDMKSANNSLPLGDFCHFDQGYLIISERAQQVLKKFVVEAGEFLPLPYKEENYVVVNITRCIDGLDKGKSTRKEFYKSVVYDKHVFIENAIPEYGLFKIPEHSATAIYCVVNTNLPDEFSFIGTCKHHHLTGIAFKPT